MTDSATPLYDKSSQQTVYDTSGQPYYLTEVIGFGGQGVAYAEQSGDYVVKIVTARDATHRSELKRRYSDLFTQRAIVPTEARLVLPDAILASPHAGYVMRRVKGHQPLTTLLHPPLGSDPELFAQWYNRDTGGLRHRLLTAALIARCFHHLHGQGVSYCDLSDKNILISKSLRQVSVCLIDPDNISTPGEAKSLVLGTPYYMAPELLRGSHQPDLWTDSYSLAVILFQMLRFGHPLLGDAVRDADPQAEEDALQANRPFVDHPDDATNRSSQLLPSDQTCTPGLTALFAAAFVDGLFSRTHRPSPAQWEEACMNAALNTTRCIQCSATFYPQRAQDPSACLCPWCDHAMPFPPVIAFFDMVKHETRTVTRKVSTAVARTPATTIRQRQIQSGTIAEEGDRAVAQISGAGELEGAIVKNLWSERLYLARRGHTTIHVIEPGSSAAMSSEQLICFTHPSTLMERAVRCARLMPLLLPGESNTVKS